MVVVERGGKLVFNLISIDFKQHFGCIYSGPGGHCLIRARYPIWRLHWDVYIDY